MKPFVNAALLASLLGALAPGLALAASGVLTGRLMFYQNQGNYCPSTRDCSGAQYLEAEYNTYQPVRDVKVYLWDEDSAVIGQSSTDEDGYFTLSWYRSTMPSSGRIFWNSAHKDGRFHFLMPSGGRLNYATVNLTLQNGTTATSPQGIGSRLWGTSASPPDMANAYDGARRMWAKALSKSNRMLSEFTDLTIYAFSDTTPNNCPTSCANGSQNRVQLDDSAAYSPQARIMHEMGHIASYKASPRSRPTNYCYPDTSCSSGGWSSTSPEWKTSSFEEGLATYLGDSAMYYWWAKDPRTCISSGVCSGTTSQVETSNGAPSGDTCASEEGRAAISVWRYLWDIYDEQDDPGYSDTLRRERYEIIDTLADFPSGFGDHEKNEPYTWYWAVDDYDGHSGYDFYYNYRYVHSSASYSFSQLYYNCYPY